MRRPGTLCALLLGTSLALAQGAAGPSQDTRMRASVMQAAQEPVRPHYQTDQEMNSEWNSGYSWAQGRGTRAGETCPPGSLYGQDEEPDCNGYYYADLNFCSGALCQRVRYENFPPPGVTAPSIPIGVVTWRGCFIDGTNTGCDKPDAEFRIRFYPTATGGGPDPNTPYLYEYHVPFRVDTGETVNFQGGLAPATVWLFTIVLDAPVPLTSGWFGLTCVTPLGDCHHLWASSDEGDDIIYEDWESDGWNPTQRPITDCEGLYYCFGEKKMGACCDDCVPRCEDDVSEAYCGAIGGRFFHNGTCADLEPACGEGLGACCYDDGDCQITTCPECEPSNACCIGDMNCDGMIDFGDINPFVLYLSNEAAWQDAYPGCSPCNGDINCDGTLGQGSFADINPFVALMTQCGTGCACPGPIICPPPWECTKTPTCYMVRQQAHDQHWAGPDTTCDPWPAGGCCTVVVPPGAQTEGEPDDCAPDTFNGGCNMGTPLFSTIEAGQTIYGKSGTFDGTRDMDWYKFNLPGPRSFTVTVEAEFDVQILAYRAGADAMNPCDGFVSAAEPVGPPLNQHNQCTPVVLQTRCVPAGDYIVVVSPSRFSGVRCYADYRVTLTVSAECPVLNTCGDCSCDPNDPDCYQEGTPQGGPPPGYCVTDPNDPTYDPENGGCNEDPYAFELLPYDDTQSPHTFTFCGKLWANQGYRDLDWYGLELTELSQVQWQVMSEVPCRATTLFGYDGSAILPPTCGGSNYLWVDTLADACALKTWAGTDWYQPGFYWFFLAAEDEDGPIWNGYPCPVGSADFGNDYTITMTVTGPRCPDQVLAKPKSHTEPEDDPPCTPGSYNDTYNSGCDVALPPGPVQPLGVGTTPTWLGRSGTWLTDPNDPASLQKDFDWYEFTLTQNRRFKVYLYADLAATWEIWKSNDCDFGPIEGLELPVCYDLGVYTIRCYSAGTYWLRVYPTGRAQCGRYYWLALTEPSNCAVCNFACVGTDLDDPCDDLTDYDTNAGCDDPNAPPPGFMSFVANSTYCGRSYGGLQNGAPYYDPDWFTVTQTVASPRKFQVDIFAEFLVHLECYTSCSNYPTTPIDGMNFITPLTSGGCPNGTPKSTELFPQNTVIYCRVTIVDQFGDLLTNYYPCAKGWNRWRLIPRLMAT